jgi:uncharacterized membrane protein
MSVPSVSVSSRIVTSLFVACAALLVSPAALAAGDPVRGNALLYAKGCAACHSFDGTARPGPTYAGLVGKTRKVVTGEKPREVVADEAYIRRSIVEPNHDIVEGYMPGAMPGLPVKPEEVDHLTAAILEIGAAPNPEPAAQGGLGALVAATIAFVGGHFVLSSLPVRRRLIGALGEKGFPLVYSLAVLAAFVWMIVAWRAAPYVELWRAPPWTRWIPLVVMPISYVLLVCGFSSKNPTVAGQEKTVVVEPRGIVRVTRHPALWGFALWGLSHLPPNGDARAVLLFGGITLLAIAGMLHIDSRRRAALGETWAEFAAKTSIVPFARGGAGKAIREIGVVRIVVGLVAYAAMLHLHKMVIGVSPLP